jgi:hemerythrin
MRKTSEIIWQDTQHQMLFVLLDRIAEEDSPASILNELQFYAESHFTLEERYMQALDYPGYLQHLAAHDKFRSELAIMLDSPEEHDAFSRGLIASFLSEWLKRHVFGIDKALEEFVLQSKVR